MTFHEIVKNVIAIRTDDAERRLFDQLVPLPEGTSYNSYLIKGSNAVMLIDSTYAPKADKFIEFLKQNGVDKIDYIVANHGEEDHTGALPKMLIAYPMAKIMTNAKCAEIIKDALHIDESKIQIFKDADVIDLGGKSIKFMLAPWVHWPDTSFAYLQEDKILFSTDFFGAHIATDSVYSTDSEEVARSAKRYYAEIMQPFSVFCRKYTAKVKEMNPAMICPSHGLIYKNANFITNLYEKWSSPRPDNKVVIAYVSMYGHVEAMCKHLEAQLKVGGIDVKLIDLIGEDIGEFAMELIEASVLVIGASMVLAAPHPAAMNACYIANLLRPNLKYLSVLGSYGWGGKLVPRIEDQFSSLKLERLEDVVVKGTACKHNISEIDNLAKSIILKLEK